MVSENFISRCFGSWTNTFSANNGIHTAFLSSQLIRWLSISLSCPGCHLPSITKLIVFIALLNYQGVLSYCITLLVLMSFRCLQGLFTLNTSNLIDFLQRVKLKLPPSRCTCCAQSEAWIPATTKQSKARLWKPSNLKKMMATRFVWNF